MSDNKKITSSQTSPKIPSELEIGPTTPATTRAPKTPGVSVSKLPETAKREKGKTFEEVPLPKPKAEPNPDITATHLKELAQEEGASIKLSGQNIKMLLDLQQKIGAKELTPEQKDKLEKMLYERTPEENKKSLDDGFLKYAISDGKPTENFVKVLTNPEIEIPSDPGKKKEKFSFFTILLLLNSLASTQRDLAAKLMQKEQETIEAKFTLKKDNIGQKAVVDIAWSISSAIFSGILGMAGAWAGPKTGLGRGLEAASQMTSGIGQSGGRYHGATYEMTASDIEKEQSRANFDQQQYRNSMQASEQQQEANLRVADVVGAEQATRNVGRNI